MPTFRSRLDLSAIPPTMTFLQKHFDRVSRPSRGRVMVRCNFPDHPDKTASMCWDLAKGKWRCFGCGRYGDAIDYLTIRYGWDFKTAARSLGAWRDDMTPDAIRKWEQAEAKRKREAKQKEAQAEEERQARIAARDRLHELDRDYEQAGERLGRLLGGKPERYRGEIELAWWFLADTLPRIREAEARYYELAGLEQSQ